MKKRAAIARAMALDPRISLPGRSRLGGLDPNHLRRAGPAHPQSWARQTGITYSLIVSHELSSIYAVADRVILIDKTVKTIVATGKPQTSGPQREQWCALLQPPKGRRPPETEGAEP